MAMDCEKIDAFPSKKIEMSKGKPEVILKESKGRHIQTSKEKNVNLKSAQPRFLVGPFSVPTPFTEDEKKLILYLFDDKLAEIDTVDPPHDVRNNLGNMISKDRNPIIVEAFLNDDVGLSANGAPNEANAETNMEALNSVMHAPIADNLVK
ncbi:hypothetical protein WN943_027563 [Citrus x changshan-huyou]